MSIERNLQTIDENLSALEYFCDTEIVGDDARHLLNDIHAAQREQLRTRNSKLRDLSDLKPLYDRLKRINSSVKVMRNTLAQCEAAIEIALDASDLLAQHIEESNPNADSEI